MTTTTLVLRGPADKAAFRDHPTEWKGYVDPLPPCDIATPSEASHVSVSQIKQAWPKFLTDWAASEAAKSAWKFRTALVDMTEQEAVDLIAPASNRQRDQAAKRGHSIHDLLEHYLRDGTDPGLILLDDGDEAAQYVDTIRLIGDECRPEIAASEVVVFGETNGVPWAGTFDAVWVVSRELAVLLGKASGVKAGDLVMVDYKSRKAGKAATRYPEEGVQIGGYSSADYWVIEDAEGMRRMAPLPVTAGLIVSIAPDGYRVYPVDIDQARQHWATTVDFHSTQRSATQMFGKPKGSNVPAKIVGGGTTATAGAVGSVEEPTHAAAPNSSTGGDPSTPPAEAPPVDVTPEGAPTPIADSMAELLTGDVLHQARTAWALRRIEAIKAAGHLATVGTQWAILAAGVPTPKAIRDGEATWTAGHLDAVVTVLDATEAEHGMDFGDPDPAMPEPEPPTPAEPVTRVVVTPAEHDGSTTPLVDAQALRVQLGQLPAEVREVVASWSHQAVAAGCPFAMGDGRSDVLTIRYTICRAALACAEFLVDYQAPYRDAIDDGPEVNESYVRAALRLVIGEQADRQDMPVGALLGSLSTAQAEHLHRIATTHVPGEGVTLVEVAA